MAVKMSFLSVLETLLIGPLKLIFEIVYETAYRLTGQPGLSILFLSLSMNMLVLPLYRRADAMQEDARDAEAKIHNGALHIKKTFSGDMRMMILQTYYRQNHYKPTDALRGSVSLLLEIPFFIAAYQYLSHLEILKGAYLGPITDLSAPDGLLVIGGTAINLLPILMTVVNAISSTLYLKDFPLKTKIQFYGIALFFFVFLYGSPAGLVFYWTLNNVFSLIKNICYKLGDSTKSRQTTGTSNDMIVKETTLYQKRRREKRPDSRQFLLGTTFLTFLIGLLIPSAYIAASPQEYVDITYFHNPLWYIVSTFCMAAGMFLIWMNVFYRLASPGGKVAFDQVVLILSGIALVNYMFFGLDLGLISPSLQYAHGVVFSAQQQVINLLVLTITAVFLYICVQRWKNVVLSVMVIAIVVLGAMSAANIITSKQAVGELSVQQISELDTPGFQFSKSGHNVVVIMLDRAMGEYIPYIFNEKPELKEQFAGFTYYDNTISFGGHTNFGSPPLFGGYEYTPVEMNKRSTETLVSKHNEALKVMPVIFSENGYDVTVCDPVYANYQWISDLSIYDDCAGVKAYITEGQFGDVKQKQALIDSTYRNFFYFSIMKTVPLLLQPVIYSDGRYYKDSFDAIVEEYTTQVMDGMSKSKGVKSSFMDSYYVLFNLPDMTDISESAADTFLLMTNNTPHEPMLLQEPEYAPATIVDNTVYDEEHAERFVVDGRELKVDNEEQITHYQANMATMIQLGNWFDYLRENGVYDNTRIILVSDHGKAAGQLDDLILDDGTDPLKDMEAVYPLLMVKDFDSEEFVVSDTFMTNADVPTLAMENLIRNPINPFTGKTINSDEKKAHEQFIIMALRWGTLDTNDITFQPTGWASVQDNIWDRNNWSFYDEPIILDEHSAP
ncbi:MAG: YidC/Oxa1 family membrane protein insertase [Lachnospiraceae bacterium]|nr:YidC/Oxa1 family membrane protein insertase [Lachnospiraceae bacterium]